MTENEIASIAVDAIYDVYRGLGLVCWRVYIRKYCYMN